MVQVNTVCGEVRGIVPLASSGRVCRVQGLKDVVRMCAQRIFFFFFSPATFPLWQSRLFPSERPTADPRPGPLDPLEVVHW